MFKLSPRSLACYATLHHDLQRVVDEALKTIDFAIICGHRDAAAQEKAFLMKVSKKRWPESKHNRTPSSAMDLVPVPLVWTDIPSFNKLAEVVKKAAVIVGVPIIWGGDWAKLKDRPHFELVDDKVA